MVEVLIKGLIGLVILAICVFVVLWVLAAIGIALPDVVIKLLYVIAVLIALLWIYRTAKAANLF